MADLQLYRRQPQHREIKTMGSSEKKPKYFCENCGEEVNAKAKFCPHCGKFFSSVRCPNCGHTGSVDSFKKGCPACHYAISEEELRGEVSHHELKSHPRITMPKRNRSFRHFAAGSGSTAFISGDTPVWLMITSIIVLIGLVITSIYLFAK